MVSPPFAQQRINNKMIERLRRALDAQCGSHVAWTRCGGTQAHTYADTHACCTQPPAHSAKRESELAAVHAV